MTDQQSGASSEDITPVETPDAGKVEGQPKKQAKPKRLPKNPAREAIARVGTTMDEAAKADATASGERREVTRQGEIGEWKKMSRSPSASGQGAGLL